MPSALYNDATFVVAIIVIALLLIWNLFLTAAVNDLRTRQKSLNPELLTVYTYFDRLCDLISKLAEIQIEAMTRIEALEASVNGATTASDDKTDAKPVPADEVKP